MQRAKGRRWIVMQLVGMILLAAGAVGVDVPKPAQPGPRAPADPILVYLPLVNRNYPPRYSGAFVPLLSAKTWNNEADSFVSLTGKAQAVYLVSSGFGCAWASQVSQIRPFLDHINALDASPLITWLPMDCGNGGFGNISKIGLPDIISGKWDAYIQQWAADISNLGYPVFVRWGHEMNIPSYSWAGQYAFGADGKTSYQVAAGQKCGLKRCFGDPNVYDGPERYIAAYRHVHDLAAPLAPNIVWVWNPNSRDWPSAQVASWNQYNNYYPGDGYVDWIALDGYNWGDRSGNGYGHWVTFKDLFDAQLNDLANLHPTKPQMIAEFASVEDEVDPNRKPAFILDAYQTAPRYLNLRILVWVQDNRFVDVFHNPPAIADFRVNSSAASLQAFQQAIAAYASDAPLP